MPCRRGVAARVAAAALHRSGKHVTLLHAGRRAGRPSRWPTPAHGITADLAAAAAGRPARSVGRVRVAGALFCPHLVLAPAPRGVSSTHAHQPHVRRRSALAVDGPSLLVAHAPPKKRGVAV
jgi:hypothetical protein